MRKWKFAFLKAVFRLFLCSKIVFPFPVGRKDGSTIMKKTRKEMERDLRCNEVKGLSEEFVTLANSMALKYVGQYQVRDIYMDMFDEADYADIEMSGYGYRLSTKLTKNRICNLMADELIKYPDMTPREFYRVCELKEIFYDRAAIDYLVQLAKEGNDENDIFFFVRHFLAKFVYAYMNNHSYYTYMLGESEIVSVLYTEAFNAIKGCAASGKEFSIKILYLRFKAILIELNGIVKLPFTLHRKDQEQYFRFRATIINNKYGSGDLEKVAEMISVSLDKVFSYWGMYVTEVNGIISTSQMLEDENLERHFGMSYKEDLLNIEILEFRDRLFQSAEEKIIFNELVLNADGVFTQERMAELGVTRYQINKVKERLRQELKPSDLRTIK